jgi:arginine/serine-rich splicing factor 17
MKKSLAGIEKFTHGQDLVFEAYIQFKVMGVSGVDCVHCDNSQEYIGFVKSMNAMKGMKLCYKDRDSEKAWTSNVKVDFDKTKHLAESSNKLRKLERERIVNEEREKERAEKFKTEKEEKHKSQQM